MAETERAPAPATLESLRAPRVLESNLPAVSPGFGSLQAYELLFRQAKTLSASTLVPTAYRQLIVKTDYRGNIASQIENANAIPNTMIALNMATRMNADPVMVMQNLIIVEGRPSWSAQWVIAQINQCGRFEPLRFDMTELGKRTVTMEYTEWVEGPRGRDKKRSTREVTVEDAQCVAWTVQKGVKVPVGVVTLADAIAARLPVIKGPKVSIGMAVAEGWYTKTGSKWQTMPELMLQYRAGAFFGRLHAPELLMGIPTDDEVRDMGTLVQNPDGSYGAPEETMPSVDDLRRSASAHADAARDSEGDEQSRDDGKTNDAAKGNGAKASDKPADKPATESAGTSSQTSAQAAAGDAQPKPQTADATAKADSDANLFGNTD